MEENTAADNPATVNSQQSPPASDAVPVSLGTNPEKPKRKFSLAAMLGIIIFLILAGGAAASFTVLKPQVMMLASKPTPTPTPTIVLTPTPDPTANWIEYKNSSYGISLKYPKNLKKSDYSDNFIDNQILQLNEQEPLVEPSPQDFLYKCGTRYKYWIIFDTSPKDETIEEAISKIKKEEAGRSVTITVRDKSFGKKGFKEISYSNGKSIDKCDGSIFYTKTYLYYLSDLKAVLYTNVTSRNNSPELLMQQILSTINFFPRDKHIPLEQPLYSYIPEEAFTSRNFIKRNNERKIPIKNVPNNNLVAFKCTTYFSNTGSGFKYYLESKPNNTTIELLPKAVSDFFVGDPRHKIPYFLYCLTEDKREYVITFTKGDRGNIVYEQISELKNYDMHTITTITNDMSSCSVLSITKDEKMYLLCGGGDITKYDTAKQVDITTGKVVDVYTAISNP